MRKKHSLLLILGIFLLTGFTMPLQNDSYPAWKTKGLIEGQTIIDNDVIGVRHMVCDDDSNNILFEYLYKLL